MLEVENLFYFEVLKNLSFQLEKPGIYALVGPNGAGKSTLLKTLCRIWNPSFGTVKWKGEPLSKKTHLEISQIMTFLPQNPAPTFPFPVREFIEMIRYQRKGSEKLLNEILEMTELSLHADTPVTELSGGERERVYFARALYADTPFLLLDEPTSSLDIRHEALLWKSIKMLPKQGKMVLITLHNLHAAEDFADEVLLLNEGTLKRQGPPEEVITSQTLFEVFGVRDLCP